jgi:hypothetical protein
MSNRERWTVYPLLFLTLGIALTDKVTRRVDTDFVQCKTLLVTDGRGNPRVIVTPTAEGGIVEAHAANSGINVILGQTNAMAGLMFSDASNRLLPQFAVPLSPKVPAPAEQEGDEPPPLNGSKADSSPEEPATPKEPGAESREDAQPQSDAK